MLTRPRLKKYLTLFPLSDTSWGLRGGADELWRVKVRDQRAFSVFSAALPYLNGRHTTDELLSVLGERGMDREEVVQLLERLEDASLIEEAAGHDLPEADLEEFDAQISFFSRHTAEGGAKYQARLAAKRVAIVGGGRLAGTLTRQFAVSGVGEAIQLGAEGGGNGADPGERWRERIRSRPLDRERVWGDDEGADPDLLVIAQEAEDPRLLDIVHELSESRRIPWLLVRALESLIGWVGPLFVPGETSSYRDLEARLRGNLSFFPEHQAFEHHLQQNGHPGAPCGGLHVFFELLGAVAVIESIKLLSNLAVPHLAGRFVTVDLNSWDTESHDVLRVPRLGLEATTPTVFAWKEMPDDELSARNESDFLSRRS